MRICRHCQWVNGDSDDICRACEREIGAQYCLPPTTPAPRPAPAVLARRNRGHLLALLLIPILIVLNLVFWTGWLPGLFHQAADARQRLRSANSTTINAALAACRRDTGGVPTTRLAILQQFVVTPGDLTPGAKSQNWKGPYLPPDRPFPANPYHPQQGAEGWNYRVSGSNGTVLPAE